MKDQSIAQELIATANAIASPGKGIAALDESTSTIGSRFKGINVENNEDNRRDYRELLFRTEGLGNWISGAILFEETLFAKAADGSPLVDILKAQGVIPGIKVDKGVVELFERNGETATTGLDGLGQRCADYYKAGARFAKWRAVLKITDDGCPSEHAIKENAWTLARYASICQANRLVPIVEPEVLMDGKHDIEKSARITEHVLAETFKALHDQNVLLEGILLKPNMVLSGNDAEQKASVQEAAFLTLRTLQRTVPPACPGIMFLSGGQSEETASLILNAMNSIPNQRRPWILSFSFGRGLQSSCLKAWQGKKENVKAAQEAFASRCRANSEASLGQYAGGAGGDAAKESLVVKNYVY